MQLHQHREYRAAPSIGATSTRRNHKPTGEEIAHPTPTISSRVEGGAVSCWIHVFNFKQSVSIFSHNLHNETHRMRVGNVFLGQQGDVQKLHQMCWFLHLLG